MSFYYFPSDFVYWEKVADHDKIKDKFLPLISDKRGRVADNNPFYSSKFTTGFGINEMNEFLFDKDFLDVVFKAICNMAIEHNKKSIFPLNFTELRVKDMWWNHYEEGEYQEPHTHPGPEEKHGSKTFVPAFSVVYILRDESQQSSIIFHGNRLLPFFGENINFDTSKLNDAEMMDVNQEMRMKTMGEGTLIVFPSSLTHMVKPCLKSGRVTIAANIFADLRP